MPCNKRSKKKEIYRKGIKNLKDELDVVRYIKNMRLLDFISKIVLTKTERLMAPYFSKNVVRLNVEEENNKTFATNDEIFVRTNVSKLVQSKRIISKKVIKNICLDGKDIFSKLEKTPGVESFVF